MFCMKKNHFLFFLPLIGFGSLAHADSFYGGFQAGADFFAVKKHISSQPFIDNMPVVDNNGVTVPALSATSRNSGIGGLGGIFFGYSWQFQDFSMGLEAFANGEGSNSRQTIFNADNRADRNFIAEERLKGVYGVSIKPGYLVNEKAKLYAKAGWVNGRFSVQGTEAGFIGTSVSQATSGTLSQWLSGWQLGMGAEIFVTPNLALNMEYNHIRYKKRTFDSVSAALSEPIFNLTQKTVASYRPQSNNVLVGITYYFTPQETGFANTSSDDGGYDS